MAEGAGEFGGDALGPAGNEDHVIARPSKGSAWVSSRLLEPRPGHQASTVHVVSDGRERNSCRRLGEDPFGQPGRLGRGVDVDDTDAKVGTLQMEAARERGSAANFRVGRPRARPESATTELDQGQTRPSQPPRRPSHRPQSTDHSGETSCRVGVGPR